MSFHQRKSSVDLEGHSKAKHDLAYENVTDEGRKDDEINSTFVNLQIKVERREIPHERCKMIENANDLLKRHRIMVVIIY